MKSIYKDKNHLPRQLDLIDSARRGDPISGPDQPGPLMSEVIKSHNEKPTKQSAEQEPRIAYSNSLDDPEVESNSDSDSHGDGLTNCPVFWTPSEVDDEKFLIGLAGANSGDYMRQAHLLGIEASGYYLSFHQKIYQWGIYLPLVAVAQLAIQVLEHTQATARQKLELAWQFVLSHERFHYAADCGVAQMEILFEQPIWWPIRASKKLQAIRELEEKLATAHCLRFVRNLPRHLRVEGVYSAFVKFTKDLPAGYNTGHELANSRFKFENEMHDHAQLCVDAGLGREFIQAEVHHLYPAFRPYDLARCPIHLVLPGEVIPARPDMFFIQRIERLEETTAFRKELQRLPRVLETRWEKTKRLLSTSVQTPGLDFKNWPKRGRSWFSVRIDQNFRAHLRYEDKLKQWFAEEIGNHAAIGHG
jgi:hypothetical protein